MGIDGLLRHLKDCNKEKNLQEYRGMKAAVDTYAWLHKIIKGPSGGQIIQGKNKKKYISDCIRRVQKISNAGIDLILVFDGGMLPRKQGQEEQRRKKRQENEEKGYQLFKEGSFENGIKKMIDSIDISPDIAYKLIEVLKLHNYKYIVAPYQADAQLAYLSRKGLVDVIITEDSDLLAFGAKRILYKLDFTTLNGYQICLDKIKYTQSTGFNYFNHNMFLTTCVMAGCDYLPQIKGVGIKLAQKIIGRNHTLKKALNQLSGSKTIPENYQDNFVKALLTFRFQRVYCPERKQCVSINQFQPEKWKEIIDIEKKQDWSLEVFDEITLEYAKQLSSDPAHSDWDFLGKKLEKSLAIKIAEAQVNPITFQKYDQQCLDRLEYKGIGYSENVYQHYNFTKNQKKNDKGLLNQPKLMDCIKNKQRKIPFEYRSVKNRSLKEDYIVVNEEDDGQKTMFPVKTGQSSGNNNKRKLLFHEQSDQEEEEVKTGLEKIAEMFDPIFTDSFLRNPFLS